jgi:hypothetical protein
MNYTLNQLAGAILKALGTINTPDLSKLSSQEKEDIAHNSNTTPETLTFLAKDEDWLVRYWVSCNPNAPLEALTILGHDWDEVVRSRALKKLAMFGLYLPE